MSQLASLLAFFYSLCHSYAGAIALLTIAVMLVLSPLTLKGTRSMIVMQALSPQVKQIQEKHKNDRVAASAELQKLFKDAGTSPMGGCLPMLAPMPVLFLLYRVIYGIAHETNGQPSPKYLDHSSRLYQDLINDHGQMSSLGIDLAATIHTISHAASALIPYVGLVVLMVVLQYVQQWQITRTAPAPTSPQAQSMRTIQKVMPPFFGAIALTLPAGLVVYWIVQSLFRVAQQWAMYRFDPVLKANLAVGRREAQEMLEDQPGRAQKKTARPASRPSTSRQGTAKNKKKRKGR